MHCLHDYIGLAGCSAATPLSGRYVNELPGASLKSIAGLTDGDNVTIRTLYDEVQKRALSKFDTEVRAAFAERYKLRSLTDSFNLGTKIGGDITPAAEEWRGLMIDHTWNNEQYTGSVLQSVFIQTVKFYASVVGTVVVRVVDVVRAETLSTFAATTIQGWNTINVNSEYPAGKLFIGYDATNIDSAYHELPAEILDRFGCSCNNFGCESRIYGATGSEFDFDDTGENSYGLSAVISVKCSYNAVVCNNKESFILPVLYFLVAEMMYERAYSDRINKWTTIGKDDAKTLYTEYYNDAVKFLHQVVYGINLDDSDCCLECDGVITSQWMHP